MPVYRQHRVSDQLSLKVRLDWAAWAFWLKCEVLGSNAGTPNSGPVSPDPIPVVLPPSFKYRMREWRHPDTHEIHWHLERRKSALQADDDT